MNRRVSIPILFVGVLALAACGGSDDTGSVSDSSPPVPATVETAPATVETVPPVPATVETVAPPPATPSIDELSQFSWQQVNPTAPWAARAGLRVVELGDRLLLMGGRTPNQSTTPGDSTLWADVWASEDEGATWTQLMTGQEPGMWPARAYFQAVVKDDAVYVIGGQDFGLQENPYCELLDQGLTPPPGLGIDPDAPCPEFLPTSQFFNDVWRSTDGVTWEQMTAAAPWEGRAGLSAAALGDYIYVFGGSKNDDSSIIGPSGPQREYFNDVWRSTDGVEWEEMTDEAPWEPRAGAATVVQGDRLLLLGGEAGFVCDPLPDCVPPYFNDVWGTTDGVTWNLVTESAGWSPRPGHACEPMGDQIVCFGGFGLEVNPNDMWASPDGAEWTELPGSPWNATDPIAVKYDFDAVALGDEQAGFRILTVGGDRETFDFTDPENFRRVDNDVWVFTPAS